MGNFLKVFWSRIQKYRIFVARDRCCLIVSFAIPAAVVLTVHTCVIGCGWNISYNVFRRMMKSLPFTKNPLVSASISEVAMF